MDTVKDFLVEHLEKDHGKVVHEDAPDGKVMPWSVADLKAAHDLIHQLIAEGAAQAETEDVAQG